jgi:multicomponent Na+:H+ antiporter subunit F
MIAGGTFLLFLFVLLGCCALCLARAALGPSVPDRMVAIDTLATIVLGMVAIVFAMTRLEYLMNVAIALALLGFVGTLALAKHLEGRSFGE